MALTERQKEIKKLQSEGLKPPQIAERLKVSPNAIYQQLSRMRSGKGASAKTGSKTGSKPAAKPAAARQPRPATTPAQAPTRPLTPLQAIRERRSEIERTVKETESELHAAEKALEAARERHQSVVARFDEELAHLNGAEAVIKGEMVARAIPAPKSAEKAKSKDAGKNKEQNGSAPAAPAADTQTAVPETQAEREASQAEFDRMVPPAPEADPAPATEATSATV